MDSSTYGRLDGLEPCLKVLSYQLGISYSHKWPHVVTGAFSDLRLVPACRSFDCITVLTCFVSPCGLHVHVNGLVLSQSLLFITQSNPNKLSPMNRFTCSGLCMNTLVAESQFASRQSQPGEWGRGNCISSFPCSAAKILELLSLLIG